MKRLVVVAAVLVACGAQKPSAPEARNVESRAHLMLKGARSHAAVSGAHLNYYGGNLLANVNVVAVFWGSGVDGTVQSNIGGFFSSVTNSSYMDWLSEYNTPTQSIGRGTLAGTYTITPNNPNTSLNDTDIQAELDSQIAAGALPYPGANTIFMTYFPPGISITQGTSQSCVGGGFCAYHGTYNGAYGETFYGVMPDNGPGSGCDLGCGGNTQFNNMTSVSSHELIEAVTDAEVGLATVIGPPLAWYDPSNGEIGDICNAQQGSAAGYTVQLEWSNARNACVAQ